MNEKTPNNTKWPTLEGRLNQPITTTLEALEQLEKFIPLSEYGKKLLNKEKKKLNKNKNAPN